MKKFRNKINSIDRKILRLLGKRMRISKEIGVYKKKNNLKIEDKKREKEMLESRLDKCNLDKIFVKNLFNLILKESKRIQRSVR